MKTLKGYYSKGQVVLLEKPPILEDASVLITFLDNKQFSKMDEDTFWNLIQCLNWKENLNDDEILAPLVARLSQMDESDIYLFQDILSEKLYLLDTKSHAEHIGEDSYQENGFFSADSFLYARVCVVANGKECFLEVLNSPEKMPKNTEFEPLLYVAVDAYFLKTGKTDFLPTTRYCYETFSNKKGWNLSKGLLDIIKD